MDLATDSRFDKAMMPQRAGFRSAELPPRLEFVRRYNRARDRWPPPPFGFAVSAFPDELYDAPRTWAEQAYPKLVHYNRLPKGGHFAAWEQPKFLSEELRAGFRSVRA